MMNNQLPSADTIARFTIKPAAATAVPNPKPKTIYPIAPHRPRQAHPEWRGISKAEYARRYGILWRANHPRRKRNPIYFEWREGATIKSLARKHQLPLEKIESIIRTCCQGR